MNRGEVRKGNANAEVPDHVQVVVRNGINLRKGGDDETASNKALDVAEHNQDVIDDLSSVPRYSIRRIAEPPEAKYERSAKEICRTDKVRIARWTKFEIPTENGERDDEERLEEDADYYLHNVRLRNQASHRKTHSNSCDVRVRVSGSNTVGVIFHLCNCIFHIGAD